jgi:hypothetical protein
MKQDQTLIIEKAGIEVVGGEYNCTTINEELETRINTRRKINRSFEVIRGEIEATHFDVFEDFTVCELNKMQEENEHFIKKLKELKISLSPFKDVVPKQSDKFEVGAILTDSWGWEQTNIDFYCIVKRAGNWLTVLPMSKITSEEKGFMTNDELPGEINFCADPQRKKIAVVNGKETGFSFRNYSGGGWCRLWNGQSEHSTHYA